MATNLYLSDTAANAEADALTPLANNGYIRIYSGTQPTNANTALGAQVLLAELRFNATSFGAAVAGLLTANAISNVAAGATGTASFYRCLKSDGTTVLFDGNIGTSASNMNLNSTAIQSGATVSITSFTHQVVEH